MNERRKKIFLTFKYIAYKLSCGKMCKNKLNYMIDKAQQLVRRDLDVIKILDKI